MKLKRSFLKRKIRFQKRKDRLFFHLNEELFLNRFRAKIPAINDSLPKIKLNGKDPTYVVKADLPALAWGLRVDFRGNSRINYGAEVHLFEEGIVEGTWDDNFSNYSFKDSPHFFGSGIMVSAEGILISPSSHFYEGIFLFYDKKRGVSYFSNSLNYALKGGEAYLNEALGVILTKIGKRNDEITAKGIFDLTTLLYEDTNCEVHVFYYHNLFITRNGCELRAKIPANPQYKTFIEYKEYLLKILGKIHLNSISPLRSTQYSTLVALSSGYDSTAVASLLSEVGDLNAVTIDVNIAGNDDSGLEVAHYLGIHCKACAHPLSVNDRIDNLGTFNYSRSFAEETAEFLATIGHGDDIVFKAFDQYLTGTAIYTGHLGDTLWSTDCRDAIGIPVGIINSKSLSEYRLRKNFLHVPMVMIGSVYPFSLHNINYQSDMKKYWLETSYNRPIPRRIVEEKGIPRGSFAKSKRSTNPYILNVEDHKKNSFEKVMERYKW